MSVEHRYVGAVRKPKVYPLGCWSGSLPAAHAAATISILPMSVARIARPLDDLGGGV